MEKLQGVKETSILRTGFEVVPEESDNLGNLPERLSLKREGKSIAESVNETGEKLLACLKFTDEESSEKWSTLGQKIGLIVAARGALNEKIANSEINGTIIANNISFIIGLAKDFLIEDVFRKQETLAKKHDKLTHDDLLKSYEQYCEIGLFGLCGEIFIKIHGMTLSEIVGQEHYVSPSNYFKLLMEANLIRGPFLKDKNRETLQKTFLENADSAPKKSYPNATKDRINECCGQIMSLIPMTVEYFDSLWKSFSPTTSDTEKEIRQRARKIIERTSALSQRILNTVYSPNSPEFPALGNTLEDYFNKSVTEKTVALAILGINTPAKAVKAYRKIRKLALKNEINSPFYEKLGSCIKDQVEQFPGNINVLTKDDAIMFLNGDNQQDNSDTAFSNLKAITGNKIFRKFTQQSGDYLSVNPQAVENWQGVLKPHAVIAIFPKDDLNFKPKLNPDEFKLVFGYENEDGEKQSFSVTVNPMKAEIDWNFLEDPDDPQMKQMRNAAMLSVKSVLYHLKKRVDSTIQPITSAEKGTGISSPAETKTKSVKDEVYVPREKYEKPEIQKTLSSFQEALEGNFPVTTENKVKKHISFPEDPKENEKLHNQIHCLSAEDQGKIGRGINEFNEKGGTVKGFKALTGKPAPDGRKLHELRIGDYRILLVNRHPQDGNGNKIWEFEIYKIGNRREIFRKRQEL